MYMYLAPNICRQRYISARYRTFNFSPPFLIANNITSRDDEVSSGSKCISIFTCSLILELGEIRFSFLNSFSQVISNEET